MESHLAFGNEPESPSSGGGFEAAKDKEKRFGERELAHTVIWKRDRNDPMPEQLKPAAKAETDPPKDDPEKVVAPKPESATNAEPKPELAQLKVDHETNPTSTSAPVPKDAEAVAIKLSQPELAVDSLAPQELLQPPTDMRRHQKEPEIRRLKIAEEGHNAISPTSPPEGIQSRVREPRRNEKFDHGAERQPNDAGARAEHSNTGEQLQHIAEQTAERAAELADRHRASPERPKEETAPKAATEELAPQNRSKEHANSAGERQMHPSELFKLSQSIRVEGVSVAEMFAARRIDEDGLRRIVTEFLRGRNIEKIITEEVVRLQLKFELDPQLRHRRSLAGRAAAGKAAGRIKEQTKKLANPKRAARRAARLSSFTRGSLREAKEIIDENPQAARVVGGIVIVLIYATILVLLITR